MDGEEEINEQTTEESGDVQQEQHLPTTDERLEHCYNEIGALRSEIAELRAHSHAELAHATHEHAEFARSEHTHDSPRGAGETSEANEANERDKDVAPTPTHWYARKVHFGH